MKRLANLGLTALMSGIAAIALAVVAVPAVTGTQAVTIESNSMQRVLPVGSLAYIKEQPQYRVGDVVTFKDQYWNLITHQIVAILPNPATGQKDGTLFQTKGTENQQPDTEPVQSKKIVGLVTAHAPWMGVAWKTVRTVPVITFLALLTIGLLYASNTKETPTNDDGSQGLGQGRRRPDEGRRHQQAACILRTVRHRHPEPSPVCVLRVAHHRHPHGVQG